ncbi:MAG: sugar phosphate isomerase/epimerase [Armatimonadota bacterium]|nr:sugar phosphate isomerase/epimerase [Armatimonadota bacterium]
MQWVMFSKMLGGLSVAEAGERIKALGFDGVDLTVRPQGHVLPENVGRDLAPAVKTLQSLGLEVPMITTAVTAADEPYARDVFAAAAECGIRKLKLGYWRYEGFGTMEAQIEAARVKLEGIARLAREYGVTACIHCHSGAYISAEPAVIYLLLRDLDPEYAAAYVDPGHMTVEGGAAGWKIGLDLLAPRIRLVAAKSFGWFREEKDGQVRWRHKLVPLNEGAVDWPAVFACLRQIGYEGVVSLHSEYQGGSSWRDLTLEELLDQTRRDLQYLRGVATP